MHLPLRSPRVLAPFVIPLSPCSNFTSVTRSFEPHTTLKEELRARVLFHRSSGLWSEKMKCWKIWKPARNWTLNLGFKIWFWCNMYDEVNKQIPVSRLGFGAYRYDWAMQMKRNHSFLIKSKVLNLTTIFNLQSYFLINRFLFSFNILVSRFKVDIISRIVLCVLCVCMCVSSLCFSDLENIHVITLIRLWSVYWSTTYHR